MMDCIFCFIGGLAVCLFLLAAIAFLEVRKEKQEKILREMIREEVNKNEKKRSDRGRGS